MSQYQLFTAEEICAMLTTKACSRDELPQLEFNDNLMKDVKAKLSAAGYEFVYDPISKYYDARIRREIRSLEQFLDGQAGMSELTIPAKALLAILWSLLVFPQYNRKLREQLKEELYVTEEQLYESYKQHIGSRKNLRKILTVLRQYDFIRTVWGRQAIKAGPRLYTAIDSTQMFDRMKNHLLDQIIKEGEERKQKLQMVMNQHREELEQLTYEEVTLHEKEEKSHESSIR